MTKLLIITVLIFFSSACGRNVADLHKLESKNENFEDSNRQNYGFQELFERQMDMDRLENTGFREDFVHDFSRRSMNFTSESVKEFLKIVGNRDLTKAELKAEMKRWVKHLGGDAPEKFNELLERVKKFKKSVRGEIAEVVTNVTNLVKKIHAIEDNMDISRKEEMKQISALLKEQPHPIIDILMSIKGLAFGDVVSAAIRDAIAHIPRPITSRNYEA